MSDAIRTKVTEILSHAGVRFSAHHMGAKKNALGGNTPMDQWSCIFERGETRPEMTEFDFFTGLGHRAKPKWGPGIDGYDNGPAPRFGTMLHAQWEKQAKPQAPHPADVLHSLILDSSAADQSFDLWCGEFGYDSDSRKALTTYEACQKNADKLRRLFARETLESLTDALQDY